MRIRTSLLCGAALGVFLATVATEADAKTAHKSAHHARAAGSATKSEIQQLREQVQSLEAWRESQQANQAQTQQDLQQVRSQLAEAQSRAAAAEAKAQAAESQVQNQIQTIPGEVQTAVKAAAPKPGWEANTSVSGRMYYDLTNINQKSDGVAQPANGSHFDIKRFYISVDHKFNNVFSANVTTDFNYDSGPAGATQLYLKKAYLQAKVSDALIIRLGAADLPWVPFVEDTYGYRYVENVMIDRTKFGTSADWGVHALGKVPAGPATFSYAVSIINGGGYKKPGFIGGVNRSKGLDIEGRASVQISDFVFAVGGYDGKLGNDVQGTPTFHTARRFDALAAYTNKRLRVGGEYFYAKDWNDVKTSNPLLVNTSEGYSAFGSFYFTPQVAVFGRYDWVKPKRDTADALVNNYFNVGLSYSPAKIVDFALVYKRDKVDNGLLSTQNGTIGGVHSGYYDEVGLFGQFRW